MEEEKIMYHYTYQIDNLINGKYYRGKHSAKSLDNDYMGSGKLIIKAIDKWGIENFKKTILKTFPTSAEAFAHEAEIVTMKEVNDPMCYNLIPGGKGGQKQFTDEELREHKHEYMDEYYQQNKEDIKEYYQQNKEHIQECQREYRQQNKEHKREYMREYNQQPEVKEHRREYMREYYLAKKTKK